MPPAGVAVGGTVAVGLMVTVADAVTVDVAVGESATVGARVGARVAIGPGAGSAAAVAEDGGPCDAMQATDPKSAPQTSGSMLNLFQVSRDGIVVREDYCTRTTL